MQMTCDEVERAIPWFLDDELEGDMALEIEAHVAQCESCGAGLEREGRLRLVLRQASARVTAPAALRRSIRESLERERRAQNPLYRAWPAAAAAAILLAFVWQGGTGNAAAADLEAVTAPHTRDWPMDVVAADVSQVQDYFNRRLPFSVRLPRIGESSVGSFGGRIMNWRDRDAAYVRYNMPRGRVSVFVYDDPDEEFPEVAPGYRFGNQRMLVKAMHGYTVAKWRSAGLTYAVVTDLPANELSMLLRSTMW